MSAIIVGEKCKICKQRYYASLGHPSWYDDFVYSGIRNKNYDEFEKIKKLGICLPCYMNKKLNEKNIKGE